MTERFGLPRTFLTATLLFSFACSEQSTPATKEPLAGSAANAPPEEMAASEETSLAKSGDSQRSVETPSILLIVVDTLRKDHLSCYGYQRSTSPNLERLASSAMVYTMAFSQAPWTTPSIGSLLSSQFPTSLGILDERSVLPEDILLLPEALHEAGYRTAAAVSHNFCSAKWNFDQGFDEFDESNILGHDKVTSQGITDRGIDFLNRVTGEPFFLWLHYFDPHFAYLEHESYGFREGPEYSGPIESGTPFKELLRMRKKVTEADIAEIRRLYDSEIAWTDREIGRMLDALRERGLYEDMLIVFTADHGEEFFEHDDLGHTKTLYNEVINVPLIIKPPQGKGQVVADPVALVDVYPTILDYAGVPVTTKLQGQSLRDYETGVPVFFETDRKRKLHGIVQGNYKMIYARDLDQYELYDLSSDPGEKTNLAEQRRDVVRKLDRRLKRWSEQIAQPANAASTELSPEEVENLRAMGYMSDDG